MRYFLQCEDLVSADDGDDCQLPVVQDLTDFVTYDYHVVYSQSYCVPVIYFNVYHQSKQVYHKSPYSSHKMYCVLYLYRRIMWTIVITLYL